jgi:VWFA-related protein
MLLKAAGAAAVAVVLSALASAQIASRPQATFRSEINYVEVDVVVTDAAGRFVPGLTAEDFELRDDGKLQTIEGFRAVDVPVARDDRPLLGAPGIVSDVTSNLGAADGRLYLLVLDDLHTTPSNTHHVRRRAREFIERYLGANDLAAVIHTSGRGHAGQDFTANRALLAAAVDRFMGRALNPAILNRIDDFNAIASRGRGVGEPPPARDREERERLAAARGTFLTILDLANYMASLSGRRKAMLLFSEGVDIDSDTLGSLEAESTFGDVQEGRDAMLQAIAAATRGNVHIYAIEASGMGGGGVGAEMGAVPHGAGAEEQGLSARAIADERRRAHGSLRTIAAETGGLPILNTNSFDEAFARIQRENSTYYLLGFSPTTRRDGRFHRIDVRMRRPGLQVRARAGYYATRPASSSSAAADPAALSELMMAAVAAPGLPMRVSLPAFRHGGSRATVLMAIEVAGEVFRFEASGAVESEDLEFVYQVLDPAANIAASAGQTVQMRVQPSTAERVLNRGFRALFPVDVDPGRYQVRIAASTKNGGRRGSVFADLDVPDFSGAALVWSGVSLTSETAMQVPSQRAAGAVADTIPVPPSAVRTFQRDDALLVYAEAYDNHRRGPHSVEIVTTLRDEFGKVAFTATEVRSSAEQPGARGVYGVRGRIPLAGLPSGSYVLTLTARSTASGNATAARDVPFAIS